MAPRNTNTWKVPDGQGCRERCDSKSALLPLHNSSNHSDASHQHNWRGGARILCLGARTGQCHVLHTGLLSPFNQHDAEDKLRKSFDHERKTNKCVMET